MLVVKDIILQELNLASKTQESEVCLFFPNKQRSQLYILKNKSMNGQKTEPLRADFSKKAKRKEWWLPSMKVGS